MNSGILTICGEKCEVEYIRNGMCRLDFFPQLDDPLKLCEKLCVIGVFSDIEVVRNISYLDDVLWEYFVRASVPLEYAINVYLEQKAANIAK